MKLILKSCHSSAEQRRDRDCYQSVPGGARKRVDIARLLSGLVRLATRRPAEPNVPGRAGQRISSALRPTPAQTRQL